MIEIISSLFGRGGVGVFWGLKHARQASACFPPIAICACMQAKRDGEKRADLFLYKVHNCDKETKTKICLQIPSVTGNFFSDLAMAKVCSGWRKYDDAQPRPWAVSVFGNSMAIPAS